MLPLAKVQKTPLVLQTISIGGLMVTYSSGAISLDQALLGMIATAETIDLGIDYVSKKVE